MLLIYIMAQSNNGRLNATYKLPNNKSNPNSNVGVLSWSTAPRTIQDISSNGAIRGPSYQEYENPVNPNSISSTLYNSDELDPLPDNFIPTQNSYVNTGGIFADRPENAPYYLFFGKFASQGVSNLQPKFVGHKDEVNVLIDQQPSNIYNIPDFPKDYTLYKSENTNVTGVGDSQEMPLNLSTAEKLVYDASSCPVNWRMFGPIREKVLDISENGGIGGGGGSLNTGLYDISNNGSFVFVQNPSKRDISGIYFDTNNFDISFNPNTNPNAYISLKGGTGTGTDLSFNEFFFKQPGMPLNCSCVLETTPTLQLKITWDKPFNRLSGTTNQKQGFRYFYKESQVPNNFVENWLPEFTELVLDISGGPNSRKFCKDICGNFVYNNGVAPGSSEAYALLSANNTTIKLQGDNSGSNTVNNQWNIGNFNYGNSGQTTTIVNGVPPTGTYPASQNVGGGLGIGLIQPANTYDIALYYRNNSLINTSVPQNDLYYNKHNVCLFENQILGQPGILPTPSSLRFWKNTTNDRTYFGGSGPASKDVSLSIPWSNTGIVKVGYDCSFSFISNSGNTVNQERVQVKDGINYLDLSYNNLDISYNINTAGLPPFPPLNKTGIPDTRQYWPHPSTNANNGIPTGIYDYIKVIDELTGVPSGKDHPEYKYIGTNYSGVNDTPPIQYVAGTGATKVIPILSREDCNLTPFSDYEDAMTDATQSALTATTSAWCVVDISNNGSVSGPPLPPTACRKRQTPQTDFSVYFVPSGSNLYINTGNDIFKQLANYGEPNNNPADQTWSELVEDKSFIGRKGLNTLLGNVELEISNASTSFTSGTIDSDVYGWDNNEVLTWANNPINGAQEVDATYKLKFDKSASFDIAQTDPLTNYSDKRGYYLGFDISNVSVELDLTGALYKDVAGLGYNPYILKLKHIQERYNAAALPANTKEFEFYTGTKPATATNILSSNEKTNHNNANLQFWFGVKRLPAAGSNNSSHGTVNNGELELSLEFDIINVNSDWIPPASQDSNTFVKAEFVYDPNSTSVAISLNSNNSNDVKWSDSCVSSNILTTISFTGATGNPTDATPSPFYVELHEGKLELVGSFQNGDGKYSRSVTDASPTRPLFGIKNNTITYSNNVTLTPTSKTFTAVNNSNFTFGNSNLELFFDYTWPVNTNDLPVSLDNSSINTNIELLQLPSLASATSIWGKTTPLCELPDLSSSSPYNTTYSHTTPLLDNQAMWCNKSFVGGSFAPGVDNPYINYGLKYFDQVNSLGNNINYLPKNTTGNSINLGPITNVSSTDFPSGSVTINQSGIKWILLSLKSSLVGTNAGDITVELEHNNIALELATDYVLFYCEYNPGSYTVNGNTIDYSTWLNAISTSVPPTTSIESIRIANTSGGNNGCWRLGGSKTAPILADLATNALNKYILIGLFQNKKVDRIKIT